MRNTDTKTYSSWEAMRQRCNNPNYDLYSYYGGRGISVCSEWDDYKKFLSDMGERPEGMTLDRIDSNKNYCPENCKWSTRSEQSFNTRMQKNNTSGKTGVCWSKKESRWIARIDFKGKSIRLGAYKDLDQAIERRLSAEIEYYGFNKQ